MKRCSRCRGEKDGSEFGKNRAHADGLQNQCKLCQRQSRRDSYARNAKRELEAVKRHRRTRPAWLKVHLNKTGIKLGNRLRARLYQAIKKAARAGSAVRDLGCSIKELRAHLEARFQPGMSWENWSPTGWHIDHIRPLASFDLTQRDQLLLACHYTNLQPLWAPENVRKGAS
jgi:hypothetical protein